MAGRNTVEVSIPADERTAKELRQANVHEAVGRLTSRIMERCRRRNIGQLFDGMDRLAADARANGLTDEIVADELAAYRAERRQAPKPAIS